MGRFPNENRGLAVFGPFEKVMYSDVAPNAASVGYLSPSLFFLFFPLVLQSRKNFSRTEFYLLDGKTLWILEKNSIRNRS